MCCQLDLTVLLDTVIQCTVCCQLDLTVLLDTVIQLRVCSAQHEWKFRPRHGPPERAFPSTTFTPMPSCVESRPVAVGALSIGLNG